MCTHYVYGYVDARGWCGGGFPRSLSTPFSTTEGLERWLGSPTSEPRCPSRKLLAKLSLPGRLGHRGAQQSPTVMRADEEQGSPARGGMKWGGRGQHRPHGNQGRGRTVFWRREHFPREKAIELLGQGQGFARHTRVTEYAKARQEGCS